MRSHHHNPGGSQNQGNTLGDRSSVRQSKLYRVHESGNVMKSLVGTPHLAWRVDQKEGAYKGQPVYDHDTAGASQRHQRSHQPSPPTPSAQSPEAKARLRAQRLHAELVRANPDPPPSPERRGADAGKGRGVAREDPREDRERREEREEREAAFLRRELARMDRAIEGRGGEGDHSGAYGGGSDGYSGRDARRGMADEERAREREWERGLREEGGAPSTADLGALQRRIGELESQERALRLREEIRALQALSSQLPVVRGRTTTSAAAFLPPYPIPSQSQLHSPTHGLSPNRGTHASPLHSPSHAPSHAPAEVVRPWAQPPFALDPPSLHTSTASTSTSGRSYGASLGLAGASASAAVLGARDLRARERLKDTRPW